MEEIDKVIDELKKQIKNGDYSNALNTLMGLMHYVIKKNNNPKDIFKLFMLFWVMLDQKKGKQFMEIIDEIRYIVYYLTFAEKEIDLILHHVDRLRYYLSQLELKSKGDGK